MGLALSPVSPLPLCCVHCVVGSRAIDSARGISGAGECVLCFVTCSFFVVGGSGGSHRGKPLRLLINNFLTMR